MAEVQSSVKYRDVQGFAGYRVGTDGSVWSNKYGTWRRMKPFPTSKYGHLQVSFSVKGKGKSRYVHRLVLEAFVGPCPVGMECCHNDGNSTNNQLANLRWDIPKENAADRVKHGTDNRGEKHAAAKLTEVKVREIRTLLLTHGVRQVARIVGISQPCVSMIKARKRWGWLD